MFAEAETPFKKKRLTTALEALWEGRKQPQAEVHKNSPQKPQELQTNLNETILEQELLIQDLEDEKESLEDENIDLAKELHELKKARNQNGWPVEMDETLTALHAQWKKTFLEQKDLQSRLYEVARAGVKDKAKEKEAGVMALRILDLQEEISSFYQKRDYYLEHGKLPDPPAPVAECLDPALYGVSYQNAMRYARDYRNKLQKLSPDDARYLKAQQQLQKWEAEAEKYRKLLKMD